MVEASPNAIILVCKTGEIVQANKQTEILFNYEQKELIGKKIECYFLQDIVKIIQI